MQLGKASAESAVRVNIPETVVYRRGKADFILQPTKDHTLKYRHEGLKKEDITKNFTYIVRARKREDFFHRPSRNDFVYGKEMAVVRYYVKGKDNETPGSPKDEEGPLRVLMENEFFELMFERSGSPIWRRMAYLQAVVKCRTGIGEVRLVNYKSHCAVPEVQGQAEEDALMLQSEAEYCLLICRRVAFFLAKHSRMELLQMRAEFMRDDNGRIWLLNATRIAVKAIVLPLEEDFLDRVQSEIKATVEADIRTAGENARSRRLADEMQLHYEEVKEKSGVNQLLEPEPQNYLSSEAFSRLRPMSVYSMEELLRRDTRPAYLPRVVKKTRHSASQLDISLPSLKPKRRKWTYTPKVRSRLSKFIIA
jgi:hypothetical protein